MKKFSVLILFLGLYLSSFSQVFVDDINLNRKKDLVYLDIIFKKAKSRYTCHIDYGQKIRPFNLVSFLKNREKETLYFDSHMAGLNYLDRQGWILVTSSHSDGDSIRYIFRRKD